MLKTRGKISGRARAVDVEDLTHISHKRIESRLCVVSGFTLIELLVVISIIMLLTITAVANFSYVQERMRLDFAADTLVSSLREGQVLAKSGRRVGGGQNGGAASSAAAAALQCYAVRIVSGVGEGSGLYTGQSAYIGLPDGAKDGAQIDTCALVDAEKWVKAEIFDGRSIISGDNGVPQTFYFKPPFGQIYTLGDGGVLVKAENKKIEFSVNSVGNSAGSEGVKKVEFDLANGVVRRR